MAQNTGQRVAGQRYRKGLDRAEEFAMFDELPYELRRIIADMPARAHVGKYWRLYHRQGLTFALIAAREATDRFIAAAEREKETGDYFLSKDRP